MGCEDRDEAAYNAAQEDTRFECRHDDGRMCRKMSDGSWRAVLPEFGSSLSVLDPALRCTRQHLMADVIRHKEDQHMDKDIHTHEDGRKCRHEHGRWWVNIDLARSA